MNDIKQRAKTKRRKKRMPGGEPGYENLPWSTDTGVAAPRRVCPKPRATGERLQPGSTGQTLNGTVQGIRVPGSCPVDQSTGGQLAGKSSRS